MSKSALKRMRSILFLSVALSVFSSPVTTIGADIQRVTEDEKPPDSQNDDERPPDAQKDDERPPDAQKEDVRPPGSHTAGSIRASLIHDTGATVGAWQDVQSAPGLRSVPLAFGMSAILPGAGQMYNGQWGKAIAAVALEAAVVTGYVVLRRKGFNAEDVFKTEAHLNWSPARYARWLNGYTEFLEQEHGANITAPPITILTGVDFERPGDWTAADRQSVAEFVEQIRVVERDVFHPETGAVFSHQLPGFGEQQYYELIGKYFQFAPGWSDYPEWENEAGEFTPAIDPEMTGEGGSKPNVSEKFRAYARDHAHSQDLLRQASRVSLLFVVNHLIASVDAAVSAKLHNDRISTRLGLAYTPTGDMVPVASVRVRLWRN